jgi:uncharacterized protein
MLYILYNRMSNQPLAIPKITSQISLLLIAILMAGCDKAAPVSPREAQSVQEIKSMTNPVLYFEIPVTDMDRAMRFYTAVFGYALKSQKVDGYDMAFFPRTDGKPGASGALAKGDVYVPSKTGAILYFDVPDIDAVMQRASAYGAKILYPKKYIGDAGYVAEIEDSEGNRIALSAAGE